MTRSACRTSPPPTGDHWASVRATPSPRTVPARCSTRSSRCAASEPAGSAPARTTPTSTRTSPTATSGSGRTHRSAGRTSQRSSRTAVAGYVAGFNTALEEDGVSGWCAGEPWVGPITTQDLYAYLADRLLLASSRNFINEIGSAQPPAAGTPAATETVPATQPVGSGGSSTPARATPGHSAPRHPLRAAGCCSPTRTSRGRASCASGKPT